MGIRETINRNSVISTIVMICMVVAAVVVIAMELRGNNGKPPSKNYYTTDDGKTWFVDSASKLPPFDHGGLPAVRCYVFKSKDGEFAGLLEKYSDGDRDHLATIPEDKRPFNVSVLVKKPGDKDWKEIGPDQEAMVLMHITGPNGPDVERLMP
ncbi:MAG TPA: hypothetical protein VGG44_11320 [Tepidisphaeraceae bacterium]